jgi:hypothetical protein
VQDYLPVFSYALPGGANKQIIEMSMNEVPIVVVVSAQVGQEGGIPRYASPRTEITKMTIPQRVLKQMIQKLSQMKEDKLSYRLSASGQSSVGSFAHNLAVCFQKYPNFKNRLLDLYDSYGHSE